MKKISKWIAILSCLVLVIMSFTACGGGGDSESADSGEQVVLSIGHVDTEDRCTHLGMLRFKELLEEKSGGTMTCEIFPNSSLGSDKEMLEQLQNGQLDMQTLVNGSLTNFVSYCNAFDLPYVFESDEHVRAVMENEEIQANVDEALGEAGFHLLAMWENGFRSIATNDHPVLTPEDAKGLQLRTLESEFMVKGLEAIGATCVPMGANEVYTACQNGSLDGYDQVLNSIVAYKTYEVTDYLALTEMYYPLAWVLISDEKWNSLTEEQQGWVEEAMAETTPYQNQMNQEQTDAALDTMREAGMEIHEDIDKAPFIEATEPVYDDLADKYDADLVKLIKSLVP